MSQISKTSLFSRSVSNEEKLGAYYTDQEHCKRIGYLFDYPEEEEVSVLETCIGDASAVLSFLGKSDTEDLRKVFGVELNMKVAEDTKMNALVDYMISSDFLMGIKVSHGSFGCCFSNPPYGEDDKGVRLEQRFLEKLSPYLKKGAPIAYVIPFYVLQNERFQSTFLNRFVPHAVYRFDDKVYKQFQQVVILGVKHNEMMVSKKNRELLYSLSESLENIPYLPHSREEVERPLTAIPSKASNVEYFTTLVFNKEEAATHLYQSPLADKVPQFFIPKFQSVKIGRPPIPLKKDLLYLLSVSGGGQGLVGNELEGDLHLQRGVAKIVKKNTESVDDETGAVTYTESSYTQTQLNVIQADGTITTLE